ncbi:S8 family peptidase [Cognatilysobacter bugurensis]|nr:S8 family serine peptidase [Lysobacter bugurensis]
MILLLGALDAHAARVSSEVERTMQTRGTARVLVSLSAAGQPLLASRNALLRSNAIQTAVTRTERGLQPGTYRMRRKFALVGAFAVDIDSRALARLRRNPDVAAIDVDLAGGGHAVAPDESSDLNAVSPLLPLGLDGAGMKVAVVDTGVDLDHPDLQARVVGEQCFCTKLSGGGCCPNGAATQTGAGSAQDDHSHGTHVAGIIVGEGVVAPRGALPRASLVAVKVMDSKNAFCCISDVIAALDWLAVHHPDVDAVNMSLGTISTLYPGDCDAASATTQAMAQAVGALINRGAVVTASAGNQSNAGAMAMPACIRDVFSAGATWDFTGGPRSVFNCSETSTAPRQPACFSNRSTTTDLYAAGAYVTSAANGGGTLTWPGTSFAAPMMAACAVALKQAAPVAGPAERMDAMRLSPTRVTDAVSGRQYPFLDCIDAVRLLNPAIFGPFEAQCSGAPVPPADWSGSSAGAPSMQASPVQTPRTARSAWRGGMRPSDTRLRRH